MRESAEIGCGKMDGMGCINGHGLTWALNRDQRVLGLADDSTIIRE